DVRRLGGLAVHDHEAGSRLTLADAWCAFLGVAFASCRFLAVGLARRGFFALRADARGSNPDLTSEGIEDRLPDAVLLPRLVIAEGRTLRRQVVWQHIPLAAGFVL